MTSEDDSAEPKWRESLASCGLAVLPETEHLPLPDVLQSIYAVTGVDVEPTIRIDKATPGADLELSHQWQNQARKANLYSDDGEFFILPPGSGGHKVGWVRVRDSVGDDFLSRVVQATGKCEVLTVSIDGRKLCAVTSEEHEYWIVVRSLS